MLEIIIINNTENFPRPVLGISVDFFPEGNVFSLFCVWRMCVNALSCCRLFNLYSGFL